MQTRREFRVRGRSARRFALEFPADDVGSGQRQGCWQVRLIQAADSEDCEVRLWAAVLEDAIKALRLRHPEGRVDCAGKQHGVESPRELWAEACAWILSRALEPMGTFESVCDVLNLDVDAVRRDLCVLAAQGNPKVPGVVGTAARP